MYIDWLQEPRVSYHTVWITLPLASGMERQGFHSVTEYSLHRHCIFLSPQNLNTDILTLTVKTAKGEVVTRCRLAHGGEGLVEGLVPLEYAWTACVLGGPWRSLLSVNQDEERAPITEPLEL